MFSLLVASRAAVLCAALALASTAAWGATETIIHRNYFPAAGLAPIGGLLRDSKGALYGADFRGGDMTAVPFGAGVVYKLAPPAPGQTAWSYGVLHTFHVYDGEAPGGELTMGPDGALYGATMKGGDFHCGTIYKITLPSYALPRLTHDVLYSFQCGADGSGPFGPLLFDKRGVLYGLTGGGGYKNAGTAFSLAPPVFRPPPAPRSPWRKTILHAFQPGEASAPSSGFVSDGAGGLYGMSASGGANGGGAVYRLTLRPGLPALYATLYSFGENNTWDNPRGGLLRDATGALYGVTALGGEFANGAIFKLVPPTAPQTAWKRRDLYLFPNNTREGWQPNGLIPDHAGGFYGATLGGGAVQSAPVGGTLFHLIPPGPGRPQWSKTILHSFGAGADGEAPIGALIQDEKGVIYGATQRGGGASTGAVFMLTTP